MMEVNKAQGENAASQTFGDYREIYNGSQNPDTNQILVTRLNGHPIRAGYEYRFKVRATYLNGLSPESEVTSIMACSPLAVRQGIDWIPELVATSST
jgi:hypothetical protein